MKLNSIFVSMLSMKKLSFPKISVHPKLIAALDALFGVLFVALLKQITTVEFFLVWFLARLLLWGVMAIIG